MRKAVYAGSFDPITSGHLWMVREGARLFGRLVVAMGTNPEKRYTFDLATRRRLVIESLRGIESVTVDEFENRYLVDYALSIGAEYILRGIRSERDYEYERQMRHINSDLNPQITTVFLVPPREIAEVSSSFVKGLIGPEGWRPIVQRYVPPAVFDEVIARYGKN